MMRKIIFVTAILFVLVSMNIVLATWWDSDWNYKQELNLTNKVNSDLTDFPSFISINTSKLYEELKLQDDCDDLRFINETDNSTIPYEIEDCLIDGRNSTIWIKLNYTALGITNVSMYYGYDSATIGELPNDVWDNNFVIVQHMEETSGSYDDSSKYGNNGTWSDSSGFGERGRIGYFNNGSYFGGVDTYVEIPDSSSFDLTDFTIEGWVKINESVDTDGHRLLSQQSGDYWVAQLLHNEHLEFLSSKDGGSLLVDVNYNNNEWQYVTFVRDEGNYKKIYNNGTERAIQGIGSSGTYTISSPVEIGKYVGNSEWLNATVDEIRLSNIARSSDWINATYLGMTSNFGIEETNIPPITTTTTTTTTTEGPTTTTTEEPTTTTTTILLTGNFTEYYCYNDEFLVKNLTNIIDENTSNSVYEYTLCDYNCSETIFGIRCDYSPFIKGIIIIMIMVSVLIMVYIFYYILTRMVLS